MTSIDRTWNIPFLSGTEIRNSYIDFFKRRDHQFVPSAPVVPQDDPTLHFINAGMNQFKSIFLGDNPKDYRRVVNSQKCIRVQGKHNDLDEVGRDTYHQTFFEMLGNWSFGDYYKKESIRWGWELLTEEWKLPKDRLFATVYQTDDEAFELWKSETDIEHWRILRFDDKENFWEMGDIGPCGPCSEINFDLGSPDNQRETYNHPTKGVNGTSGRYVEIWNHVFIQYERRIDGSLKPLKQKHVDTGMGLERICSVIQQTGSNYQTDLFQPILGKIAEISGVAYEAGDKGTPHRVIADHLRTLAFAITDGVTPGNEGRGYVLRRVLRRAARFANSIGLKDPVIFKLVPTLIDVMGPAFPDLPKRSDYVQQVIEAEEVRFLKTLEQGLQRFTKIAEQTIAKKKNIIPGKEVFTLYDTYGFPIDLTGILAIERNLAIDDEGYQTCMEEQRQRARDAQKFDDKLAADDHWKILNETKESNFVGYQQLNCQSQTTRYQEIGDDIFLVLQQTPFYPEAGGQVGDQGTITGDNIVLRVVDTIKVLNMIIHRCKLVNGLLTESALENVNAAVDPNTRMETARHHSATHLLHAGLRKVLGTHVQQQGSRVSSDGLRFDFTHHKATSRAQLSQVENMVNLAIMNNHGITIEEQGLDEAKQKGAIALFGEKYDKTVRTIKMADVSFELCGGTHVNRTGDIGPFVILDESSIAAGIRRIEAAAGSRALHIIQQNYQQLGRIAQILKTKPKDLETRLGELQDRAKKAERESQTLRLRLVNNSIDQLLQATGSIGSVTVLIKKLDPVEFPRQSHQFLLEGLAGKLQNGISVLTHAEPDQLTILVAVGKSAQTIVKAGDLAKRLAEEAGGRGGGRPDRAQAGTKHVEKETGILASAEKFLQEKIKN